MPVSQINIKKYIQVLSQLQQYLKNYILQNLFFFKKISRSHLYLLSCFFVFSVVLNCSYFQDGRKYIAFIGTLFRTFSFVLIS